MNGLSPRDAVPALRADLDLGRVPLGVGAEVYRLSPGGQLAPQLTHGYALSILRMLDGRRTAGEVITNCERIGLPIDLEALEGLIRRARAKGLLADARHPGVDHPRASTPHRASWSPEARERFRDAVRCAREGDLGAARDAAEAVLTLEPTAGDAALLLEWIARQRRRARRSRSLKTELRREENIWRGHRAPLSLHRTKTEFKGSPPRFVLGAAIAAAALALLALTTFVPVSRLHVASVRFEPMSVFPVQAHATGVVDAVLVREGQWVRQGQPLLRFKAEPRQSPAYLVAPSEGEVTGVRAEVGGVVERGQRVLRLADSRELRMVATMTPSAARSARPGDVVSVAFADRTLSAVLEGVGDYEVVARIADPDRALRSTTVEATVALPPRSLWDTLR